jgi:hypothetical protein
MCDINWNNLKVFFSMNLTISIMYSISDKFLLNYFGLILH